MGLICPNEEVVPEVPCMAATPLSPTPKLPEKLDNQVYLVSYLFFFLPNITTCGHEIKRCLLLGRKVMTNLDSIFKSRDITLPTKIHLVKAMVFPVVIYGCESWTVKKAEH